jgi:hypothetical protein
MTETPAPAAPAEPAAAAPAPAAVGANKQAILRAFYARINAGEFDLAGGKDFHRFVVKEIYPLLAAGTLQTEDLEKIAEVFSARANPYKTKDE